MEYRVITDLGHFGATGLIEIPAEEVKVEQRRDGDGGSSLVVDLSGLTVAIPQGTKGQVVVKDNLLTARSVFDIPHIEESRSCEIVLPRPLHPSRTEIEVCFTEPGDSRIIALCKGLRLRDETLDWSGGESFFRTRRDPGSRRPVTFILEQEGPLILLGELGPRSSKQAAESFHFLACDVIAGIEKCVTHLLLDEDGRYSGKHWDHLRKRVADARGFDSWREVVEEYVRNGDLEETARECAAAFFSNKAFWNDIKRLHEAQVRNEEQEDSE